MFDDLLAFAVAHYVVVGLALLLLGLAFNFMVRSTPDTVRVFRHPRLL